MKAVYQASPLLCIPKKSGKLRTVVNARKRNDNTFKDMTPFPDQDQIRMDVARAKYRTKIDMSDAYERPLLPRWREHLEIFIRVYLDNIFVYSDTIKDHEGHLQIAFNTLQWHHLLSRPKLDLYSEDMDCLGHRIDDQGLHVDSSKMPHILEWRTPRSYPEVLRFMGLVKYLWEWAIASHGRVLVHSGWFQVLYVRVKM
jgi:hypothetical protein